VPLSFTKKKGAWRGAKEKQYSAFFSWPQGLLFFRKRKEGLA